MDIKMTVAGFGVGFMVGMTGIGGGALMTPILVLLFGTSPRAAVGTDLIFAAITKMVGVTVHGSRGTIDWQVFRRLSSGSIPAAIATGLFLYYYGRDSLRIDSLVMDALGGMLLVTAAGILLKRKLHQIGRHLRLESAERYKRLQRPLTVLAGIVLGIVVTLTSVGAGAFGAVIMLYLYPLRLTPAKLVGTDIMHAIPLALVAGSSHLITGNVKWLMLAQLLSGSIPGVLLGAWWSTRSSDGVLRYALAGILALSGIKILLS